MRYARVCYATCKLWPTARGNRCLLQKTKPSSFPCSPLLLLPRLVHNTCAVRLPLLQQRLALPLRDVERVDVTTRLDAEPAPRGPCSGAAHGGDIDVLARVELEGGLGAVDLEVDARGRVVGGDEPRQGSRAGVEGHGGGG